MTDKLLTHNQVEVMFSNHLKTVGSNPGSNWIGKLVWKVKQKNAFVTELKNKGYTIR